MTRCTSARPAIGRPTSTSPLPPGSRHSMTSPRRTPIVTASVRLPAPKLGEDRCDVELHGVARDAQTDDERARAALRPEIIEHHPTGDATEELEGRAVQGAPK